MKQIITLLSLIFFLTLFSFGQKKENKDNRFGERFRIENQTKNLNLFENVFIINALFNKCKGLNLNSKFNSHQTNSSPMIIKYGLDSELSQSWDETISQWFNSSKTEYTYNTNGYPTQEIYYFWDGSQWLYDVKLEYTYDINGDQIQTILFDWLSWGVFMKFEHTYDINGNLTLVTVYDWDSYGNQWVLGSKIESTYDTNGDQIQYIIYNWEEDTSQWSYVRKTEYTYDNNRNQTQYIEYSWDGSSWWYDWKTEYTYDNNGNLTQYIDYSFYNPMANWLNESKTEYTYENNGNLTQYIDYSWVEFKWDEERKTNFTYNDLYSYSDLILPYNSTIPYFYRTFESKIFFNHMLTNGMGYIWDSDLNDWAITDSYAFSYSQQDILNVTDIIDQQLKLYPNPVSNILTIKSGVNPIDKVEIYSILGKKIMEINFDFDTINTEDLSKGIYLLWIYTEKGIKVKKMIKK